MVEVSVLLCAYNEEKHIVESISSIVEQDFDEEYEIILVNDASTDNTLDIMRDFEENYSNIRVINNRENLGVAGSLQKGIKITEGKYVARQDADDISFRNRLSSQYRYLEGNKDIIVLGTSAYMVDDNGNFISDRSVPTSYDEVREQMRTVCSVIHPTVMFRRQEILDVGGYKDRPVEDYDLWFRCLGEGYKIENLDEKLLYFRIDEDYHKRNSFEYRWDDAKVRWEGYNRLNISYLKRYPVLLPLFLAVMPNKFIEKTYSLMRRFDPRENAKC